MISQLLNFRAVAYLIIFVSVSLIINYFLKWERFSRLAEVEWNKTLVRIISVISQILILILLLDETGLLLKEWNISSRFLETFRHLLELPGLSQLVLIANFALVIPATYSLSEGLIEQIRNKNSDKASEWVDYDLFRKKYSTFVALFVLIVTLLFFLAQCLFYDEFQFGDDLDPIVLLIYVAIIFSGLITGLTRIISINRRINKEHNPYKDQPWCEKNLFFFTFLIFFMSFAQTMITKVILLLTIVDWAAPGVIKYIGKILPFQHKEINRETKSAYERTVSDIVSSSFWHKWNFLFFTTSAFALLIIYQFHCSPYPPSDSAFPKTETVSGLYMIYMILYLLTNKGKYFIARSVIWMSLTILILYGTPVLFPSWFLPSIDPPGFSIIEILAILTNIWTSIIFIFVIHLIISISCILAYYSIEIKEYLITNKFKSIPSFKKYLFIKLFSSELFIYVIFGLFFIIVFSSNYYAIMKSLSGMGLTPFDLGRLEILILLVVVIYYIIILNKTHTLIDIREEVIKFGEEDAVNDLAKEVNLLKLCKNWHDGDTKKSPIFLYLILVSSFSLFMAACMFLPQIFVHEQLKINWSHKMIFSQLPSTRLLKLFDDKILFNSNDSLFCSDLETGKIIWALPLKLQSAETISQKSMIFLAENELFTFSIDSCKRTWKADMSGIEIPRNVWPRIIRFDKFTVLKIRNDSYVFDNTSGRRVFSSNSGQIPEPEKPGGPLFLITENDKLQKLCADGTLEDIYNFRDTVKRTYFTGDLISVKNKNNLLVFSNSGRLMWTKRIPEKSIIRDIYSRDSLMFINFRDTIKVFGSEDGLERWTLNGYNLVNTGINIFSGLTPFSEIESSCFYAAKDRDLHLLNIRTGKGVQTFKNVYSDQGIVSTSYLINKGDYLACIGTKDISLYSNKSGKKICTHDYLNSIYQIDKKFFHGNRQALLTIYCAEVQNDNLYILNHYGLISMKLKN